ncbi:hypothetical protein SN11_16875 [Vibrio harveyi]|nr:hypothetical protein SN11_16875 [Vibrio harveyi]
MTQLFRSDEASEFFYGITLEAKQRVIVDELIKMNSEIVGSKSFGYLLYDNNTFPVLTGLDRDFFAENYMGILKAMQTAGTYDSYILVIEQVVGDGVGIEFSVPKPRALVINIFNVDSYLTRLVTPSNKWLITPSNLGLLVPKPISNFALAQLTKILKILANPTGTYLDITFHQRLLPSEIVISGAPASPLNIGDTGQLTAEVTYTNGSTVETTDKPDAAVWASSDESLLTIDANGNYEAVASGSVSVTATAVYDDPYYDDDVIDSVSIEVQAGIEITLQPQDQTVMVGEVATFSSDASNWDEATDYVKWQEKQSPSDWADISGAESKVYTTPPAAESDNGKIVRAVFSRAGTTESATSNSAELIVIKPDWTYFVDKGLNDFNLGFVNGGVSDSSCIPIAWDITKSDEEVKNLYWTLGEFSFDGTGRNKWQNADSIKVKMKGAETDEEIILDDEWLWESTEGGFAGYKGSTGSQTLDVEALLTENQRVKYYLTPVKKAPDSFDYTWTTQCGPTPPKTRAFTPSPNQPFDGMNYAALSSFDPQAWYDGSDISQMSMDEESEVIRFGATNDSKWGSNDEIRILVRPSWDETKKIDINLQWQGTCYEATYPDLGSWISSVSCSQIYMTVYSEPLPDANSIKMIIGEFNSVFDVYGYREESTTGEILSGAYPSGSTIVNCYSRSTDYGMALGSATNGELWSDWEYVGVEWKFDDGTKHVYSGTLMMSPDLGLYVSPILDSELLSLTQSNVGKEATVSLSKAIPTNSIEIVIGKTEIDTDDIVYGLREDSSTGELVSFDIPMAVSITNAYVRTSGFGCLVGNGFDFMYWNYPDEVSVTWKFEDGTTHKFKSSLDHNSGGYYGSTSIDNDLIDLISSRVGQTAKITISESVKTKDVKK